MQRIEGALEAISGVTMTDMLLTSALAATGLIIANNGVALYQSLFSAKTANNLDLIASAQQCALSQYQQMLDEINSDSHGALIITANTSIDEFQKILSSACAMELSHNKKLLAKLYYLRAQAYALTDNPRRAERDLLTATKHYPEFTLAHNLLAHLYLHYFDNIAKAKVSLETSLTLNLHQVYAKFYLSMLKDDIQAMTAEAEKIVRIYAHQFAADSSHALTPDFADLLKSTPFITIPYILVNWGDIKIERERNPQALLTIADAIHDILTHKTAFRITKLRIMMHECRIAALLKIASLKRYVDHFNHDESNLCGQICLSSSDDQSAQTKFHFISSILRLDKSVTNLFPQGFTTSYLQKSKYQNILSAIIIGWAKKGSFCTGDHPLVNKLLELLSASLDAPASEELSGELAQYCAQPDMINYFIKNYIEGKGSNPWFIVVPGNEQIFSLLHIACEEQGVCLNVYGRYSEDPRSIRLFSQTQLEPSQPVVHVFYDSQKLETGFFSLLHEICKPADLYHHLILQESQNLLVHDPVNPVALNILGENGAVELLVLARKMLTEKNLMPSTKAAILGGLDKFIQNYNGVCLTDYHEAMALRAQYAGIKNHGFSSGLFTAKNTVLLSGAALILGAALVYSRK